MSITTLFDLISYDTAHKTKTGSAVGAPKLLI